MSNNPALRCQIRLGILIAVLGVGLLAGGAGCSDDPAAPTNSKKGGVKRVSKKPSDDPEPPKVKITADSFAKDFLAAVAKGEAKNEQLTDEFKKWIAPPRNADDEKVGHNAYEVNSWLASIGKGGEFTIKETFGLPEGKSFRGEVAKIENAKQFGLSVIPSGSDQFQVDWFMPTKAECTSLPSTGSPEIALALTKACQFLDLLRGREFELASRMMSAKLKLDIAGGPTKSDEAEGLTYNKGWLGVKLQGFAGYGSNYTLKNPTPIKDGLRTNFLVDLGSDEGLTLTVAKTDDGWAVTELEKQ